MRIETYAKTFLATAGIVAFTGAGAAYAFNQGDNVTMNGKPLFEIPCGAQGFSAERRAWQAQDALDNALYLTEKPCPDCVSVGRMNNAYVLKLHGYYIATADSASAGQEGLTPKELADKWANSLADALSDQSQTAAYVATLKDPNRIQGDLIAERRIFAPPGTTLPVAFQENLSAANMRAGQKVYGRVVANVPVGSYYIPADSMVIGKVKESHPGVYTLRIETLRTPSGSEIPVNAMVTDRLYTHAVSPHAVATLSIPANGETNTRIPAKIGIGTGRSATLTAMTFTRESGIKISQGEPTNVVLEQVSSVAVVPGKNAM